MVRPVAVGRSAQRHMGLRGLFSPSQGLASGTMGDALAGV